MTDQQAVVYELFPGSNHLSRREFIERILNSGQVTRISQHLALVIFLLCEGSNQAKLSVRDLERITGWGRTAIKDHLSELEVFMKVTFPGGRGKTLFELQGVIEDAINAAIVAGSQIPVAGRQTDTTDVVAVQAATNLAGREADTSNVVARQTDTIVGRQPDTTQPPKERVSPHTPLPKENKNTLSLSLESDAESERDPVQVSATIIRGPNFILDVKAIEMAAALIGMDAQRAVKIAEVCARDWACNGKKPEAPMAMVKAAIRSDFNRGQVDEIRVQKARGGHKKLSRW